MVTQIQAANLQCVSLHQHGTSLIMLRLILFRWVAMRSVCCLILLSGLLSGAARCADPADLSAADVHFFETRIRPALVKYCYECHSASSEEVGGGLLVDSRESLLRGGEAGPAVVPGEPDDSLIIQALRYDGIEMPPDDRVSEAVVNDLVEWVKRGAPDPRTETSPVEPPDDVSETVFWSFQPPRKSDVPDVRDSTWPRNEVDHFVLAKIEAAGTSPGTDADPQKLIRRLVMDLTGLPASLSEVQKFQTAYEADSAAAVSVAVDELLCRPQFGERWGRHWLDIARYAESNGNDGLGRNATFPHAWRYRDYVIAAFNDDTPWDRFLTEQIAGDLLPAESDVERDRHLVATGFLALAAKPAKAMNTNFEMDVVADQIDVVGRGIMGISVACARCHDHKFDPIPTRDYYALAGFFTSSETMWGTAAHEKLTAPATDLHVLQAAQHVAPPEGFVETVLVPDSNTGKPKPIPESKWPPGTPLAMGVRDAAEPADCKINIKGDAKKTGDAVPRGFLSACQFDHEQSVEISPEQSGRLELAQWLTRGDHPLTARVMVNRIWQHLFGEGIVRTPNDFGVYGARPTHPELLDYLAVRFVEEQWSVKRMIRLIATSRTYQLSSEAADTESDADESGSLLTRRLDAEALRDSMLAASGQLDLTPAEGSIIRHRDILLNLTGSLHQPSSHRSVYLCYLRSSPPPELAAFDLPEFSTVTGQRNESTVPGQALHLFNNPFVVEQATCLAKRVMTTADDTESRIRVAWHRVFSRDPEPDEIQDAQQFLDQSRAALPADTDAWASLSQALLLTSEFRYVD